VPVLRALAEALGVHADLPADHGGVRWAFLDHHGPSLNDAVAELQAAGVTSVAVLPVLLSDAFHARNDVPRVVKNAAARHRVELFIAAPIGLDDALAGVVARRVADSGVADIDTVVVAAAGTGSTEARDAFRAKVRSWRGRHPYRLNAAFIAGGAPAVPELVESLIDQGQTVVVVPFLIADGALATRARRDGEEAGASAVTDVLGAEPELVDVLVARAASVRVNGAAAASGPTD
jgi:sirohydrochlorin ferrochelatase